MNISPMTLVVTAFAALLPSASFAQSIAGEYRCWTYDIRGGGGTCMLVPPFVLNSDGTYQRSSEKGTYKVEDGKVVLSESKIGSEGKIDGHKNIVFDYDFQGVHRTVTYVCMNCSAEK